MGGEPARSALIMTGICRGWVDTLSRMLDPDEREVVRGDLAESGETGAQALLDVLGLVVRRQTDLWKDWRPWLALVGLVVPLGILLSLVSRHTADGSAIYIWLYANNWDWAFLGNAAFRHDFPRFGAGIFMSYLTLSCWSWTSGFVLGSLSRRAIQVNGALFCLMLVFAELSGAPRYRGNSLFLHRARDFDNNAAVFTLTFYRVLFPLIVQAVLVVLPSLCGMRQGLRPAKLPPLLHTIVWTPQSLPWLRLRSRAGFSGVFPMHIPGRRVGTVGECGCYNLSCTGRLDTWSQAQSGAGAAMHSMQGEQPYEHHNASYLFRACFGTAHNVGRPRHRCRATDGPRRPATRKGAQARAGVRAERQFR